MSVKVISLNNVSEDDMLLIKSIPPLFFEDILDKTGWELATDEYGQNRNIRENLKEFLSEDHISLIERFIGQFLFDREFSQNYNEFWKTAYDISFEEKTNLQIVP